MKPPANEQLQEAFTTLGLEGHWGQWHYQHPELTAASQLLDSWRMSHGRESGVRETHYNQTPRLRREGETPWVLFPLALQSSVPASCCRSYLVGVLQKWVSCKIITAKGQDTEHRGGGPRASFLASPPKFSLCLSISHGTTKKLFPYVENRNIPCYSCLTGFWEKQRRWQEWILWLYDKAQHKYKLSLHLYAANHKSSCHTDKWVITTICNTKVSMF